MRTLRFPKAAALGALSLLLGSAALSGCSSSDAGEDLAAGLTGDPVTIGYVNTEGKGAVSFPGFTTGIHLAVERFNNEGGLDGRPIVLEECFTDGTPESSIACANDFVQKQVVAVTTGIDGGFDSAIAILEGAKVPVFATQLMPGAAANPAFFQISAPTGAFLTVPLQILADDGVDSFAYVGVDLPQARQGYDGLIKPAAKEVGLESRLVAYDPATTDYTSVVSTLKANGSQAAIFAGSEEQCTAFARSVTTLGYEGRVLTSSCTDYIDELGGKVAGFQALGVAYLPKVRDSAPMATQAELDQYLEDVQDADKSDDVDNFSLYGYGSMTDLSRVLAGIDGEVTSTTVMTALSELDDFDSFAGDMISCADRTAAQGASCGNGVLLFEVTDQGGLTVVGDGFIENPSS